jgi:23S rRNA (adenine1618-N6)-methyltransferase
MDPRKKKRKPPMQQVQKPEQKPGLHTRNRFGARYDFDALTKANPALKAYLVQTPKGSTSIDFKIPEAVRALNKAILADSYALKGWDFPPGYLCAPIPGRADYIHVIADLMSEENDGGIPDGGQIIGLDIGVGATCIYPIIGFHEYGWRFVGTDIDHKALDSANQILSANPNLQKAVTCRFQPDFEAILVGAIQANESFDFTMSNPPFHKTMEEAQEGSARKWRNLGVAEDDLAPVLNFGGQENELRYPGGELDFIRRMILQSVQMPKQVYWFTTLVAQKDNLPALYRALQRAEVRDMKTVEMAQGQKTSRVLAWTFLDEDERALWKQKRWTKPE